MQLWVILPVVVERAAMGIAQPGPHLPGAAAVHDGLLTFAKVLVELLPRPPRTRATRRRSPKGDKAEGGAPPSPPESASPPPVSPEEVARGYRLLQAVLVPPFSPAHSLLITTLPGPYHEYLRAQIWNWRREGRPNALMPFVAVVPVGRDLRGQVDPPLTEDELVAFFQGEDGRRADAPLPDDATMAWEEEAYGWRPAEDMEASFELAVYQSGRDAAENS